MSDHGKLLRTDEALRYIDQIQDPVTKTLVNMAFVHLVNRSHLEKRALPEGDFDTLFFVSTLAGFFAEQEVIARALEGERVGAWFEDGK